MKEYKKIKSQIDNEASKNYYFPFNLESFKKVYKKDNASLKSFSEELFNFINGLDYDYLKNTRFVNLNYIDYVLKSPYVKMYYSHRASGTSDSMPKINQKIVTNTLIPLPPLAEQKPIVERLDQLLPLCDELAGLA